MIRRFGAGEGIKRSASKAKPAWPFFTPFATAERVL
jgi:hypothetical protein